VSDDTTAGALTPAQPAPGHRGEKAKRTGLTTFIRQVVAELRKVIWPNRSQLITYTIVVVVFVTVMMAITTALDFAFTEAVRRVFGS
jgi:preprotein translocase subunit SecE